MSLLDQRYTQHPLNNWAYFIHLVASCYDNNDNKERPIALKGNGTQQIHKSPYITVTSTLNPAL